MTNSIVKNNRAVKKKKKKKKNIYISSFLSITVFHKPVVRSVCLNEDG